MDCFSTFQVTWFNSYASFVHKFTSWQWAFWLQFEGFAVLNTTSPRTNSTW
jgi:hypothetical protein